jgi:hypothetical protein
MEGGEIKREGKRSYHVLSAVGLGQHFSRLRRADFEVRDDGDGFQFRTPLEAAEVADVDGWDGWCESRLDAAGWLGQDFAQGHFDAREVFG